jgi:O-antigen ligase
VVEALGVGGETFTLEKFQGHVGGVFYGASYDERVATIDEAVQAWREHPLLGIGIGSYGPYTAPHPAYIPKDGWKIVNNEYIEILSETGLTGLFFFILFIVWLMGRSLQAIKKARDEYLKAIMIGLSAAFVGILVQYLTFSTLYIMHIWFLVGFMIAVQNIILIRRTHGLRAPE